MYPIYFIIFCAIMTHSNQRAVIAFWHEEYIQWKPFFTEVLVWCYFSFNFSPTILQMSRTWVLKVNQINHLSNFIKGFPLFVYYLILDNKIHCIIILQIKWHFPVLAFIWLPHCAKSVQIRIFFWSVFSCIWTENRDLQSKSPYWVRMQDNMDQKKLLYLSTFHAVPKNHLKSI